MDAKKIVDYFKNFNRENIHKMIDQVQNIMSFDNIKELVLKCVENDSKLLDSILDKGFDTNSTLTADGYTLLHMAAKNRDHTLVKRVLGKAVEVDKQALDGTAALHISLLNKDFSIFLELLQAGANPDLQLPSGEYPVHRACRIANSNFLQQLQSFGADTTLKDSSGNLALHIACAEDMGQHITLLISSTDDINCRGQNGRVPLHFLACHNDWPSIKYLLLRGASFQTKDNDQLTPLDILISADHKNVLYSVSTHFTKQLTEDPKSIRELLDMAEFNDFVRLLNSIENIRYYCPPELQGRLSASNEIFVDLREDDTGFTDFIANLSTDKSSSYNLTDVTSIELLSSSFVRYILMTENTKVLKYAMGFEQTWHLIEELIVSRMDKLYEWSMHQNQSSGASEVIAMKFMRNDIIEWETFQKWLAIACGITYNKCERCVNNRFKNPLKSLTTWAILTGKFEVFRTLLKLNHLDMVPMTLYACALMKKLSKLELVSFDVREMYAREVNSCERIAIEGMFLISRFDISPNKTVCVEYVRMSLPNMGGVTCLDLAAKGKLYNFLQLKVCQHALSSSWYGDLYNINPVFREVIIILGAIPYNIFVPQILVTLRKYSKSKIVETQVCSDRSNIAQHMHSDNIFSLATNTSEKTHDNNDHVRCSETDVLLPSYDVHHENVTDRKTWTIRFLQLLYFLRTPAVKFRYHTMSLLVFLFLLSYVVMLELHYHINPRELVCYLYLLGFLVEEIYELITHSKRDSIKSYFKNLSNLIDIAGLSTGTLAFVMRIVRLMFHTTHEEPLFIDPHDLLFYMVRVSLCVCLLCYFVKLISIGMILQKVGPKVKMMATMIWNDFIPFLYVLFVFMIGFGIVFQALLYPNGLAQHAEEAWNASLVLQSMVKLTFYSMMGEFQLDRIEGEECVDNCPHEVGAVLVPLVFMIIYVIITNILLLNLVIALFSKTVEDIDSRSQLLWEFERYSIVQEYTNRSSVPPPLNLIQVIKNFVLFLGRKYCCKTFLNTENIPTTATSDFVFFLVYQAFALRKKKLHLGEAKHDTLGNVDPATNEIANMRYSLDTYRHTDTDVNGKDCEYDDNSS